MCQLLSEAGRNGDEVLEYIHRIDDIQETNYKRIIKDTIADIASLKNDKTRNEVNTLKQAQSIIAGFNFFTN